MDDVGINRYHHLEHLGVDIGRFDITAMDIVVKCSSKGVQLDSIDIRCVATRRDCITTDFGTVASVMPPGEVPEIPTQETNGHKKV